MKKKIVILVVLCAVFFGARYLYIVELNYNIKTVSEGKVYKSGVIPPDELADYVKKYNIKSVVDLRYPGTDDLVNNPEVPEELIAEKNAVEAIEGVNYYNVGSEQVPSEQVLERYFEVMDDSTNYPVLIHCYHGEGRAPLFSALYRMEYEGVTNEEARDETRFLVKWSSFDDNKPKGEFLKNYKPRSAK